MNKQKAPAYHELMNPLLAALKELGGSGSIDEIYSKVVEIENFSEEILAQLHDPENSSLSKVGYNLAWARTYLKKYGLLENSSRGVWSLTDKGRQQPEVDAKDVIAYVREEAKAAEPKRKASKEDGDIVEEDIPEEKIWKKRLFHILTEKLSPAAFERLTQRILRESGFVQVEVTGRTGDGGIDGRGIAKVNGLMSFHVLFQCKKYKDSVGAGDMRNFRGAMQGRADKGLFITTGSFTSAAIAEATRDGAPPIDLVDGNDLMDKLKELNLGVAIEMVEKVSLNEKWFEGL
jgi:restriction system protein